jgi:hypothetical protein
MKIIFLDIDGVLNAHRFDKVAQSTTILRQCMRQLNRIIHKTDAKIIICSAWRYMLHGGAMNLTGFKMMLRTHGLTDKAEIVAVTPADEFCTVCSGKTPNDQKQFVDHRPVCMYCLHVGTRGEQVRWTLRNNPNVHESACTFVALDDMDLGYAEASVPLVQVAGTVGLTKSDADRAIALLNGCAGASGGGIQ